MKSSALALFSHQLTLWAQAGAGRRRHHRRAVLSPSRPETPDVMEGLALACREPALHGIDPHNITYYFRRVMVIPTGNPSVAVWRKSLFATMHLNANLPAAYFGVPAAEVVEVGLEVEI
jgi:K+ transporter